MAEVIAPDRSGINPITGLPRPSAHELEALRPIMAELDAEKAKLEQAEGSAPSPCIRPESVPTGAVWGMNHPGMKTSEVGQD